MKSKGEGRETYDFFFLEKKGQSTERDVAETYLIVIEVSIDRKAMLSFFLSLCRRLASSPPPLDQRGVTHAAKQVRLRLQLRVLVPHRTQCGALINSRAFGVCRNTLIKCLFCCTQWFLTFYFYGKLKRGI